MLLLDPEDEYLRIKCSQVKNNYWRIKGIFLNPYIHRYLMNPDKGYVVDHINGNKSDNRKCNLRVVTYSENSQNGSSHKDNLYSDVKGVSYLKSGKTRTKRWRVRFNYKDYSPSFSSSFT